MPKYAVPLTSWANISVTVVTDETDPEKIASLAAEAASPSLCHQCAGGGNDSLDVGDEWDPVINEETGKPEVYREND
ncbi:hypothetical protein ABZY09_30510 [Streptomyces sp. NPDC002928]|uniref:hypothetical protein n=1 Tax=Streptomyces sp. NPDC002928 TaxID=3154440 RepID=UPI0033B20D39